MQEDLVFDIGMHLGEDTQYYLMKGFRVVGFEANPGLVRHCELRFSDALAAGRLRIISGAIAPGPAGSPVTFHVSSNSVLSTANEDWVRRNPRLAADSRRITVPVVSMEEAYAAHGVPFFMKIDIEGHDEQVLTSLESAPSRPRHLSLESERTDFSVLVAEIERLVRLGYTKFRAVQQSGRDHLVSTARTRQGEPFQYRHERHASGPFGDDLEQPWMSAREVISAYAQIFSRYRLFGESSAIKRMPRPLRRVAVRGYKLWTGHRGPLPGWYDTHATY